MKHMKKLITLVLSMMMILTVSFKEVRAENEITENIISEYAIVIDHDSHQILSAKNADKRMYPASLTKMMTCLIAMENLTDTDQKITITSEMLQGLYEANASVAGFYIGDEPTVLELLYASALPSGADASNALAITIAGSVDNFVKLMNKKAKKIGMDDSHFTNVTGLHDEKHYSTAHDMARLLDYCLENPLFEKIFSTESYTTQPLRSHPYGLKLESTSYSAIAKGNYKTDGFIGGKTGFTNPAGRCLAAWSRVNDINIISVTGYAVSTTDYFPHIRDLETILKESKKYEIYTVLHKEDVIKEIKVKHFFSEETITVTSPDDFTYDCHGEPEVEIEISLPEEVEVLNDAQTFTELLIVNVNGETVHSKNISVEIPAETNFFKRILIFFTHLF